MRRRSNDNNARIADLSPIWLVWQNGPMLAADISALQKAIRRQHGCDSRWLRAVAIHEILKGETVWRGEVQVFHLVGHPEAETCYAWSYQTEKGKQRFVAILRSEGVDSPLKAVQAAVASGQA